MSSDTPDKIWAWTGGTGGRHWQPEQPGFEARQFIACDVVEAKITALENHINELMKTEGGTVVPLYPEPES